MTRKVRIETDFFNQLKSDLKVIRVPSSKNPDFRKFKNRTHAVSIPYSSELQSPLYYTDYQLYASVAYTLFVIMHKPRLCLEIIS
jgi:hypothetical protein